jgi:hypothetical protein
MLKKDAIVANMTSYAICSSLILVIHDNMTNGANKIVEHVFVDISRSQWCKNTMCQTDEEKERKDTVGWTDGTLEEASVQPTDEVEYYVKTQDNWHHQLNWWSIFYMRRIITRDKAADSVAPDELMAWLVWVSIYPMNQEIKIESSELQKHKQRLNWRW